ncbi:hypothetical protein EES44_24340 [Streptomyces sp. ADI96-15]|nr:hypothetical protein EES44_24340 [Streptomyces sp. ADI96-15]
MGDLPHRRVPLGHSIPAHRVLGWCSHCPDRSLAEEVAAWQLDAQERHEADQADGPLRSSVSWQTCTECGHADSLSVAEVTVRAAAGPKRVGGWRFCVNCEAAHAGP